MTIFHANILHRGLIPPSALIKSMLIVCCFHAAGVPVEFHIFVVWVLEQIHVFFMMLIDRTEEILHYLCSFLSRIFEVRTFLGEYLPGLCGVAFEAFGVDGGRPGGGGGVVGLLPVAFAVPKVAWLVLKPEGVGLGQHQSVERDMFLSWVRAAGWQPLQVGVQFVGNGVGVEVGPLLGGSGTGSRGVVLCRLVAVEGVHHGLGHFLEVIVVGPILPFFLQLLGEVIRLVSCKAAHIGLQLRLKVKVFVAIVISIEHTTYSLTQVLGICLVSVWMDIARLAIQYILYDFLIQFPFGKVV